MYPLIQKNWSCIAARSSGVIDPGSVTSFQVQLRWLSTAPMYW